MLANRILNLTPSPTLSLNSKIKELQSKGEQIINLTAGEPNFDAPNILKKSVIKAVEDNFSYYTPVAGLPKLRQAIAQEYARVNKINYELEEVIVCTGAKQVIHNALLALCNPNDEVIVHTPTWSTYVEQIKLAGAKPIELQLEPPFLVTADKLASKITPQTKVIILNYPANPTGMTITKEELSKIADLAIQHKVWIISDEIYEKILFDSLEHCSIASLNEQIRALTLTVSGLSKSHAITGWRLGWGCGPKKLITAMSDLQGQTTSGACSIVQQAAISAFTDTLSTQQMARAYQERRDYLVRELTKLPQLEIIRPQGAFYLFVGIKKLLNSKYPNSNAWCEWLLEQAKVAVVPGEAFLQPGYFRLSFAASQENLEIATDRICSLIKNL